MQAKAGAILQEELLQSCMGSSDGHPPLLKITGGTLTPVVTSGVLHGFQTHTRMGPGQPSLSWVPVFLGSRSPSHQVLWARMDGLVANGDQIPPLFTCCTPCLTGPRMPTLL
jgi:hypothetical protein